MLWPFRLAFTHIRRTSYRFGRNHSLYFFLNLAIICGSASLCENNWLPSNHWAGRGMWARLAPVIGLVQVGWQGRPTDTHDYPDRFIHSSYMGCGRSDSFVATSAHSLKAAAILTIGALESGACGLQTRYRRDSETLSRMALAVTTNDVLLKTTWVSSLCDKVSWTIYFDAASRRGNRSDNWFAHEDLAEPFSQRVKWPRR